MHAQMVVHQGGIMVIMHATYTARITIVQQSGHNCALFGHGSLDTKEKGKTPKIWECTRKIIVVVLCGRITKQS